MPRKSKTILLFIACFTTFIVYLVTHNISNIQNQERLITRANCTETNCNCQEEAVLTDVEFFRTNNQGARAKQGANYIILFDPKSPKLDFKVSVGLSHDLYAETSKQEFYRDYVPKQFHEIITDNNAKLNGKKPIVAINADYIDPENKPQGLNVSRGVEYSGVFKNKRSSFGISGGRPEERKATIQIGKRNEQILNYNLVGGNGRFYREGKFKDICEDLGEFACHNETARSMVAITSKGYVILLVNNSERNQELYPDQFDDVLEGIARTNCLGSIQDGMLFDGGLSVALYFNNKIYVENLNPIGSVFLIYETDSESEQ